MSLSITDYFCTKRHKAEHRVFKKLFSKRNTNNGDAPYDSADKGSKRKLPSKNQNPKDIKQNASESKAAVIDIFLKRGYNKSGDFKALEPCRNSDYADTKKRTGKNPFQPENKSAKKEPKNISQSFHKIKPFII